MVIHGVFVVSGMTALLYQLIWQRSLLVLYGSHTESVAMVVAAFLVGLGCGGLVGGILSRQAGSHSSWRSRFWSSSLGVTAFFRSGFFNESATLR